MTTKTVTNTILDPGGTALANVRVRIYLRPTGGYRADTLSEVAPVLETTTNGSGVWTANLEVNDNILPSGSYYVAIEEIPPVNGGSREWPFQVLAAYPASNNLYTVLLATLPASSGIQQALTKSAADLLYSPIGGGSIVCTSMEGDESGSGTLNSASYVDLSTAVPSFGTMLVPAAVGDVLLIEHNIESSVGTPQALFIQTVIAGTRRGPVSVESSFGGGTMTNVMRFKYTVTAPDISGGNVAIKFQGKGSAAVAFTILNENTEHRHPVALVMNLRH